jgi:hypothetical protein
MKFLTVSGIGTTYYLPLNAEIMAFDTNLVSNDTTPFSKLLSERNSRDMTRILSVILLMLALAYA